MEGKRSSHDKRLAELERRLQEAEETVEAIRSGAADALVIAGPDGDRVYTLKDADRPYRLVVEEMNEGAAALTPHGDVLFCNRCLGEILRLPCERIIGRPFRECVAPCDVSKFDELVQQARYGSSKGEIGLGEKDDELIPVHVSLRNLSGVGLPMLSMVISDVSERKRTEQCLRELTGQIELMQEDERRRVSRELHDDIRQQVGPISDHLAIAFYRFLQSAVERRAPRPCGNRPGRALFRRDRGFIARGRRRSGL